MANTAATSPDPAGARGVDSDDNSGVRERAVVWDVFSGWFLGQMAAVLFAGFLASAMGWNPVTPNGIGAPIGRALTEAAAGLQLTDPPAPFISKVMAGQIPFWVVLLGIPFFVTRLRGRSVVDDFGLRMKWIDVPIGLAAGVVSQLLLVPLLYLTVFRFIDTDAVDDEAVRLTLNALSSPGGPLVLVLLVAVGAPVVEEIAYRGGLQRALRTRLHPGIAIAIASLVFGLAHVQLVQLPALVLIGVVAGTLAWRFDRIGPAVLAHVGFNGLAAITLLT